MFELNAEMTTDVWQSGRVEPPHFSREFYGANETMVRPGQPGDLAGRIQHALIKPGIVCCNKIYASQHFTDDRPQLPEGRLTGNLHPVDSMNIGEDKGLPGRLNKESFFFYNSIPNHLHKPDSTCTVRSAICCLEVNRSETRRNGIWPINLIFYRGLLEPSSIKLIHLGVVQYYLHKKMGPMLILHIIFYLFILFSPAMIHSCSLRSNAPTCWKIFLYCEIK